MKKIMVWDLPTRLFHWCLVCAVFYSWFSIDVLENMQHHFYSGYVVLTLVLFRVGWGFIGSPTARFRSFLYSRSEFLSYTRNIASMGGKKYLGHNPLGSISVIVMAVLLLAQAIFGLYSSDDYYFGPLSGLVDAETIALLSELHSLNSDIVFAMIGLHIVAIAYYKIRKKEALTLAMISGKKGVGESDDLMEIGQAKPASNVIAIVYLVICIALVYWLATAFLDRVPTSTESYY